MNVVEDSALRGWSAEARKAQTCPQKHHRRRRSTGYLTSLDRAHRALREDCSGLRSAELRRLDEVVFKSTSTSRDRRCRAGQYECREWWDGGLHFAYLQIRIARECEGGINIFDENLATRQKGRSVSSNGESIVCGAQ